MSKFALKLNNGDPAVLHSASRDWVPIADLGLCTLWRANKAESERDAALDREMKLERERDAKEREIQRLLNVVCDSPACTAAVIRRDDGSRICAAGHSARWVNVDLLRMTERAQDAAFRDAHRAEADAARLREALEALVEYERKRHPPKMGGDEFPPSLREVMDAARAALASTPSVEPEGPDYSGLCSAPECGGHCGYVHARGCEAIREYLADHGGDPYKAPSRAEPTPRDMRVAEAVAREYERKLDLTGAGGLDIDLAAVVAKAVGT